MSRNYTINILAIPSVLLFSQLLPAQSLSDMPTVLTLSAGPVFTQPGKTQTLFIQSDLVKSYQPQLQTETLGNGEIYVGKQRAWHANDQVRVGLAIAATSRATLMGTIWDDADPNFDNFTYRGEVEQLRVMAEGKWLYDWRDTLLPYLSGGIGVGFNRSYDFTNTPKLVEQVAPPAFTNTTHTAFTYTLGVGLEKKLDKRCTVGIGYQFADWGKSYFGTASGQTIGTGPVLNHLYTSELQFSFNMLI